MENHLTVLGAPSNLGLAPPAPGKEPGVRRAPGVLRRHGLVQRVGAADAGDVPPPRYQPALDPRTRVRNGPAIRAYTRTLATAVQERIDDGRFPLVLGGDCSILLGPMLALRRLGTYGLVFIDGHRDFQTPDTSQTGGAAGMDLALTMGHGPEALTRFEGFDRLVEENDTVVLGYRDVPQAGADDASGAIFETACRLMDLERLRQLTPERSAQQVLVIMAARGVDGFWIHLDVDVLNTEQMPAVDSPQPDGMTYAELHSLLAPLLQSELSAGMDITIFDPGRDSDDGAGRPLADWIVELFTEEAPRWKL